VPDADPVGVVRELPVGAAVEDGGRALPRRTDVEQVDDSYVFHGPDYWKWPPNRTDRWGVTPPRSPRLKRIQELYTFTDDHRIDS